MGNVYLWKVGDKVVNHTDLAAASQLDGLTRQPDKTLTEEQFSEANGLARVIGGKIVLGETPEEKTVSEKQAKISECKAKLAELDRKAGAGRAVRDISMTLAERGNLAAGDAYINLKAIEDEADVIRAELEILDPQH